MYVFSFLLTIDYAELMYAHIYKYQIKIVVASWYALTVC